MHVIVRVELGLYQYHNYYIIIKDFIIVLL